MTSTLFFPFTLIMEFFLNKAELSVKFSEFGESDKSLKHELGSN